ncbi:MAG TPA: PDDEXK nuclease domain-containing protein [Puia sp.]|jgi:predicted nuclease of restriction endonuclease-like (RecB) superfamily|nr:PDDEXK nuclease domain-containing protein [Puia sp.]
MNSLSHFYSDVTKILKEARLKVYTSINTEMVMAYWLIGKRIVEEEQAGEKRAEYGTFLVNQLSGRLSKEFGKGFSVANVWNFRQFYLTFPENEIPYALRRELSWTHYRSIMRVENREARLYYITEAASQNWSTRQLDRNINTFYYERLLSTRNPKQMIRQGRHPEMASPKEIIKDPYVLEFLDIPRPRDFSENDLEKAIISKLQEFLLELGKGFCFVGRQYHMKTDTRSYFIDLVFYNFMLKCFVLVDLKLGELTHQDIGQMDMYVRMFEDLHTTEGDNATIGIILCAEKDNALAKYSILEESKHIFASKYKLILPTPEELKAELEREIQLLAAADKINT